MEDTRAAVNELLVDLFNRILYIEERTMKKHGVTLSMTEIHILENIDKSETKTIGDAARLQGVTMGTMSVAVNSLSRKGYLVRCRDTQDKRIIRLFLTGKAYEVLKIHRDFHDQMIDSAFKEMDLEGQQELLQGLKQLSDYFKQKLKESAE